MEKTSDKQEEQEELGNHVSYTIIETRNILQ